MNRKSILNEAWQIAKTFVGVWSFGEAMHKAWLLFKLRKALKEDKVVCFYYQKQNGEIRQAFGTLNAKRIPQTNGEGRQFAFCQKYFDVEKQEWRMFKTYNILRVEL